MKRVIVMCMCVLMVLLGCQKEGKDSVNKDASISFARESISVGATYSEALFLAEVSVTDIKENTKVSVKFPCSSCSEYTFEKIGKEKVTVVLTLDDDVFEKELEVTVVEATQPVIIGAYDREVALNSVVDLSDFVKTEVPGQAVSFTPSSIDTSRAQSVTVTAKAVSGSYTDTKSFTVVVTNKSTKSEFAHYGQTYGGDDALNVQTLSVLVNKRHGLGSGYVPNNLVTIEDKYAFQGRQGVQLVKEAYDAFVALNAALESETDMTPLSISTAYRSYGFQSTLYNNYVASDGKEAADTYSARPGFSEHQTGLAMDLAAEGKNLDAFGETKQAKWVAQNAARFGFIIRFPDGKDRITGYQYESWHIRYVGDMAQSITDSGLTFDEYFFAYNLAR